MRTCFSCNRKFQPSSKHKNCPSCRYRKTKTVLCDVCGINVHSTKYKNCIHCTNIKRADYGTGRYLKNGYVMTFSKGHPRTHSLKGNYVFEHILVMERHIGRLLEKDETVHHKNGVKNDNSIDNLELWVKPQPSGVRAKDALDWAHKIIERYEIIENEL